MKDPRDYLANYTPPSAGHSLGRLKDDPGDETGSGITVLTHNDFLYAFISTILKHRTGGLSEADESESASDFRDALEELVGAKVHGVSDWSAATTYNTLGTAVMRGGMQFTSIRNSYNTNKPPETNPLFWLKVPKVDTLVERYHEGIIIPATLSPLHTYGGTYYQQTFSLGRHRIGDALTGAFCNAFGIHLDGTTVVGGSTLATAIAAHWAKDIIAPDVAGVRTLKDLRECVIRSMGAAGGNAPTLAEVQAAQNSAHVHDLAHSHDINHTHTINHSHPSSLNRSNSTGAYEEQFPLGSSFVALTDLTYTYSGNSGTGGGTVYGTGNSGSTGGAETRGKSFVAGVPYVVALVAA